MCVRGGGGGVEHAIRVHTLKPFVCMCVCMHASRFVLAFVCVCMCVCVCVCAHACHFVLVWLPNRARRKLREQKRKLQERLVKKAEAFKESDELMAQERMFSLKDIKTKTQLEKVDEGEMADIGEDGGKDADEVDGSKDDKGDKEDEFSDDDDDDGDDDDDDDGDDGDDDGDDNGDGDDDGDDNVDDGDDESEKSEDVEAGIPVPSGEPGKCLRRLPLCAVLGTIVISFVSSSQPFDCVTEWRIHVFKDQAE